MYENDIEWLTEEQGERNIVKSAVWSDETFREFVAERGLEDSLYAVTDFHREVANQLKAHSVSSKEESEWARRTIGLCVRVKSRRQELRRTIRALYEDGDERIARVTNEVESDWED